MAKKNPGDILTGDWNPVVGCQRYSPGCRDCWWLDGIMPWQKRLGNLPVTLVENRSLVLKERLTTASLKPKKGIIGVVQHGDLFWDAVSDQTIHKVLDIVDEVAQAREERNEGLPARKQDHTKYILWTKRAERLARFMKARYPDGVPHYLACGVSVEDQKLADERLPHLLKVEGYRFIMIEPMLGPVDLKGYEDVHWVVVGSETGGGRARPLDLDWVRALRDFAIRHQIPFFVKQLGKDHRNPQRRLDGRTWNQFPEGFRK